ncbi:MAG TPA: AAA family ATPase, partial [Anaeromyxobacteraceae bacterium]
MYLLGRFEVVRGDAPVPGHAWRRRRPADLLKLVALAPGRALPRERVVEALWPGRDHASGANNLHRALYDLRQILGGRWVDLDRGQVRLRTGAWVDVEAFETAAGAGDPAALELAAALYRGPLAPEDLHAAWLAERRAELRRRFAAVALSAAGSLAGRGEAGKAIPLLRRAADADPLSEPVHHLLARLLAEAGRRAEALRQVEVAEEALRAAGREPGEPLRALRAAIQRGEVGPTPGGAGYDGARRVAMRLLGTADPPPLRGRPAALGLIEALAGRGCGGLVLLGEPGVGKTRLAVEGARLAQSRGAVVLAGTTAGADGRPYGPFADAFADYYRAGGTAGSDPFAEGPAAGGVEGEKLRLFEAVRGALRAVGGGKPVYLLLDEVDEVDESSANLVHYLLRGAEALPLAVVATCREESVRAGEPVRTLLAHLDAEKLARGARLQRLDLGATREQLADLLGVEPPAPLAAQFHRVADGNPYRAEELARAWREGGRLPTGDLAAAIRERAGRLGPEAGALLAAGAVAGRRFDLAVAATAADLPEEASRAAAERCLEAQLLDEDDGALRFHHALAREALLQAIPAPRRAAL